MTRALLWVLFCGVWLVAALVGEDTPLSRALAGVWGFNLGMRVSMLMDRVREERA